MLAAVSQMALMAAVVATLAYIPLGLVLALVVPLFGISFFAMLTFGGAMHFTLGLLAWWLLVFVAACVYSGFMFPWEDGEFAWPGRK